SHGPATLRDFVWWTGLTVADARAAVAENAHRLVAAEVDGETCWHAGIDAAAADTRHSVHLLPVYDEYTVAYRDRSAVLAPNLHERARGGIFGPVLLSAGRVAGVWRRERRRG